MAEHAQSVQDQRHLLLVFCHGALHQRPGHPDGDAEGHKHTHIISQMWFLLSDYRAVISVVTLTNNTVINYFMTENITAVKQSNKHLSQA